MQVITQSKPCLAPFQSCLSCSHCSADLDDTVLRLQGTRGGECIQIGAAADSQTAADTNRLSGTVATGAATFAFIQAWDLILTHAMVLMYKAIRLPAHECSRYAENRHLIVCSCHFHCLCPACEAGGLSALLCRPAGNQPSCSASTLGSGICTTAFRSHDLAR